MAVTNYCTCSGFNNTNLLLTTLWMEVGNLKWVSLSWYQSVSWNVFFLETTRTTLFPWLFQLPEATTFLGLRPPFSNHITLTSCHIFHWDAPASPVHLLWGPWWLHWVHPGNPDTLPISSLNQIGKVPFVTWGHLSPSSGGSWAGLGVGIVLPATKGMHQVQRVWDAERVPTRGNSMSPSCGSSTPLRASHC